MTESDKTTVDIEELVDDAQDLSALAYQIIGGECADLVGEPDHVGYLDRQVRITGILTIEDHGPGLDERRRLRRIEKREQAIERHAVAEGAEAATTGKGQ